MLVNLVVLLINNLLIEKRNTLRALAHVIFKAVAKSILGILARGGAATEHDRYDE